MLMVKKDTKKAKAKSNVVAMLITFDDYMRCLFDKTEMTRKQSCIRSKLHEVYTISETKIALSLYNDEHTLSILMTLCYGDIIKYHYRYVFSKNTFYLSYMFLYFLIRFIVNEYKYNMFTL